MLAVGGRVTSGASLVVLLEQDDATSMRTTAAAARRLGLDTLRSSIDRSGRPGQVFGVGNDQIVGRSVPIISAFSENRRVEGSESGREGLPRLAWVSEGLRGQRTGRRRPASRRCRAKDGRPSPRVSKLSRPPSNASLRRGNFQEALTGGASGTCPGLCSVVPSLR